MLGSGCLQVLRNCRRMIEKDDNFEQVTDSYLHLVAKIVEKSEGVFLWARIVVNSLLVGLLRHDNIDVLEKKLEVTPTDMNQLPVVPNIQRSFLTLIYSRLLFIPTRTNNPSFFSYLAPHLL